MSKIADLEGQQRRLVQDMHTERSMTNNVQRQIERYHHIHKCQICVSNDVTHVLIPCGHCICGVCSLSLRGNKCPFCRREISQKVHFYMSGTEHNSDSNA